MLNLLSDEYEIEAVLGCRKLSTADTFEFLIKWKGLSSIWNTWELEGNLQCPELLKESKSEYSSATLGLSGATEVNRNPIDDLYKSLRSKDPVNSTKPTKEVRGVEFKALEDSRDLGSSGFRELNNPNSRNFNGSASRSLDNSNSQDLINSTCLPLTRTRSHKVGFTAGSFLAMMNSCGGAKIAFENRVDDNLPPAHFQCISSPIFGSGVPLPDPFFLIGCDCGENGCNSNSCLCISQNNDCLPVYSPDGKLLIDEGPIYECNQKCPCPDDCSNRVIQKGRKVPLTIVRLKGDKGWGVKATNYIPKGTFIDLYLGEIITSSEATRRFTTAKGPEGSYLFDLDFNYESGSESEFTVDAYTHGNITHFINHSCEPNLRVYPCFLDSWDPRLHYLAFFAMKDINRDEELTFDYLGNQSATKLKNRKRRWGTLKCSCGAPSCRGFIY